jgi:predicted nuclease of restriction endonuclease-like (RecB) superfamily
MNSLENVSQVYGKVSELIQSAQNYLAKTVNSSMVVLYWHIGKTIQEEVIKNEKAGYGEQVMQTVAAQLTQQYGRGYSYRNLYRMVRFYEFFPDEHILTTVSSKLSWSHLVEIIKQKDPLKREFYVTMCANEGWSVRELSNRINSMLFERTAISKKPEETIYNDLKQLREDKEMSVDLFLKDPYMLDFLGLENAYAEKDLETAILVKLQHFILEFGSDFAFLARQKRITIDQEDYYIDLLFYHRKLKRLVAIELKLGKFRHEYKSQLELYLRWLNKYERQEGENPPLGLLLCAEKSDEIIELLELDKSGIHVATYLTELPPLDWLRAKLHKSIEEAQNRLNNKAED